MIALRGFQTRIVEFPEPQLLTVVLWKLNVLKNMQASQKKSTPQFIYVLLCLSLTLFLKHH